MSMIIIICAILFGMGIMYGIIQLLDHRNITNIDFNATQKKVMQGLTEKKDAYEKEMTEEILNKVQALREKQEQLEKSNRAAEEDFQQRQQQLENDYQRSRLKYEELDKQAEENRQKNNEKKITEEQEAIQKHLAELNKNFDKQKEELTENFQQFRENINSQKATLSEVIKAFEERQRKIIERFKHDEEIKQQRNFYHIKINDVAAQDIAKLKTLALQFSKPECLYKLLYEVYYKTPLEELFKRVLGENKDKGGIYKITNINNEKVYIGKTTNLLSRWRLHAKRGCNIERISGQLYEAMFEEGLQNFTWEILELCPKEEQTEKEKYWIQFYHSSEYGYNQRIG